MTGMVTMNFDIPSQRFYEDSGFDKQFFYDNGFIQEKPLNLAEVKNAFETNNETPF